MKPTEVPAEYVQMMADAEFDAPPGCSAADSYRTVLAAVLTVHERQVREQALRDLDAGSVTPEDLAAAGLDTEHIVDLRADGWTIQHPLTCRTDLFGCPVNRAAERDLTEPPDRIGRYACGVDDDGLFVIGELKIARTVS